jgi:hypothetical protein
MRAKESTQGRGPVKNKEQLGGCPILPRGLTSLPKKKKLKNRNIDFSTTAAAFLKVRPLGQTK